MTQSPMRSCAIACLTLIAAPALADGHTGEPSFFLTSAGPGAGGDLGGLAGADAHCAALADIADLPAGDWVAYLSATGVNARDRIGSGPWYNAVGTLIAEDVDDLHDTDNGLGKDGTLSETGEPISGRGDSPNRHDILTGSDLEGRLMAGLTCEDWTTGSDEASAQVGHHDLTGGGQNPTSFNSAHASLGCSQTALQGTGGDGLFYCFKAD